MAKKPFDPRHILHDMAAYPATAWKWPLGNGKAVDIERQEYTSLQNALEAICGSSPGHGFQIVVHANVDYELDTEDVDKLCSFLSDFHRSRPTTNDKN